MRSPRSHRRRAVVAALALAALTATPALAMPDRGSVGMPSPAGTTSAPRLDLRSPDAVDASIPGRASHPRQPLPGPPTWPIHPVPFTPAGQSPAAHDDGTPWSTIWLGLAGGCLAAGAAGVGVGMRLRARRTRHAV